MHLYFSDITQSCGWFFLSEDGQPCTTSRAIAEYFGKRHSYVLRAIRHILKHTSRPEFNKQNFVKTSYKDSTGRFLPEYRVARDGFAVLAGGFTGVDALKKSIAFFMDFSSFESKQRKAQPPPQANKITAHTIN